ncbi:unnamed protein product [Linum trigynum]|uniref:Gnk2-homologous domain-containing protein n=1 Tax=Linum trigynum TaxID=586398 RepID=A0AAV2EPC1_9ROSI
MCNKRNFSSRGLLPAKSHLLGKLIAKTYSKPNYKYCTGDATRGGGRHTMYGYAYCSRVMVCDGGGEGRWCPTSYEECSGCLATAGEYLTKRCKCRIGGHVKVNTGRLECYIRYETRKFRCS